MIRAYPSYGRFWDIGSVAGGIPRAGQCGRFPLQLPLAIAAALRVRLLVAPNRMLASTVGSNSMVSGLRSPASLISFTGKSARRAATPYLLPTKKSSFAFLGDLSALAVKKIFSSLRPPRLRVSNPLFYHEQIGAPGGRALPSSTQNPSSFATLCALCGFAVRKSSLHFGNSTEASFDRVSPD